MTGIEAGGAGRRGNGKSMQEEKWGDSGEVEDRGLIVKVLTGRWQVRRGVR